MSKFCKIIAITIIAMTGIAIHTQAQVIQCGGKHIKIKNFVADSMITFNSRYVKYGAVTNIKESPFQVEIRVYSTWISSENIDLKTIQATKDSVFFKHERIWLTPKGQMPNYRITYDGGTFQVNVAAQPVRRFVNTYSDFFQKLADNNLFAVKGEEHGYDFKRTEHVGDADNGSQYWIEVKVGKRVRNFYYLTSSGLDDTDPTRQAQMKKIIELINEKFSKK